jgi:hypothetical protein|tara:strand:+ start:632 stop:862 length:231 start_codon:yes stop_codon:yes gene_type:complete
MVDTKRAGSYNPMRRQLANPLRYGPYEFKEINGGISVSNPTTQFWNVAHGPPITLEVLREVQLGRRTIQSVRDLRR